MACMNKVGKDVTFQITKSSGMKLCVINEATTVFVTFNFTPQFFESFRLNQSQQTTASSDSDSNSDSDEVSHNRKRSKSTKLKPTTFKSLLKPTSNVLHTAKRAERLRIQYVITQEEVKEVFIVFCLMFKTDTSYLHIGMKYVLTFFVFLLSVLLNIYII